MPSASDVVRRAEAVCSSLAQAQSHVLSRRQLRLAGVPRWYVARELRARRWQPTGRQTVVAHNGPIEWRSRCWVALFELDPRAALAGVTALRWCGLEVGDDTIEVIVPKGARGRRLPGVRVRESRRYRPDDVDCRTIRRTRPAMAAVHAALWAVTDRQAAFFLTLVVQQGMARPGELAVAAGRVRRARRRSLLVRTVADLAAGSRSLGEVDLAVGLRERGLPQPARQSLRRRPSGAQYLDAEFPEHDLVLELDGAQHDLPGARLTDLLRDLALVVEGRTVLRIPMAAWWLDREAVLDALVAVFASRGWRLAA